MTKVSIGPLSDPDPKYPRIADLADQLDRRDDADQDLRRIASIARTDHPRAVHGPKGSAVLSLVENPFGMLLITTSIGSDEHAFLVDTAAQTSAVTERLVGNPAVDSDQLTTLDVGSYTGAKQQMQFARVDALSIGDLTVSDLPVLIVPDAALAIPIDEESSFQISGIVGWDVLRQLDWSVSVSSGTITIAPSEVGGCRYENFIPSSFPVVVGLTGGDDPVFFGIDTGAKASWLSRKFVSAAGLPVSGDITVSKSGAHGPEQVTETVVSAFDISIGSVDITFQDVLTGFTDFVDGFELSGVLGHDVLAKGAAEFRPKARCFELYIGERS